MKIKDLILALAAVFFMSCGRDKPTSCLIGYEFEVPFTITPTTDTISTGDTLWLSTDFTNYLKDHVSGSSYTVNDFDFKAVIILRQLVSDTLILSAQPGAYPKFDFKELIGSIAYWGHSEIGSGQVVYQIKDDHNLFMLGIIPKQKGVYTISVGYPVDYHEKNVVHVTNTKCEEQIGLIHYSINDGANNHFDMLENNCDLSFFHSNDETMYRAKHWNYTFAVK